MRIADLSAVPSKNITQFNSEAFDIGRLGFARKAQLSMANLGPGGSIGRHPAVGTQMLIVLSGDASVSGSNGEREDLRPGQAVIWQPGEEHDTRTDAGLLALIIEGSLELGPRPL